MKSKIFTISALLCSVLSYSQTLIQDNFPTNDGLIEYQEVVKIDSANSDLLYQNAKKWIAATFRSTDAVIQTDDKSGGLIILKSYIEK